MKSAGRCICAHNQPALEALAKLAKQCSVSGRNKFRFAIMRAMKSLQAYPLPIASEREAMQLEGVGNFMANEIMKALRHHAAEDAENVAAPANGVRRVRADSCSGGGGGVAVEGADDGACMMSFSQLSQASEFADLSQPEMDLSQSRPAPRPSKEHVEMELSQLEQVEMDLSQSMPAPRPSKEYVPETGRGPWVLLVTLHIVGGSGSRLDILHQATTVEECGLAKTTLAASWASSIRTLMSKDLVQKTSGTVYSLTETGSTVARSAHEAYVAAVRALPRESAVNELQSSQSQSQSPSQSQLQGVRRKISPADRSTGESPALVRQRSDTSNAVTITASSFSTLRSTVLRQLSDDEAEKQPTESTSSNAADTLLQLDLTQISTQSSSAEATAMSMRANYERRQLTRAATYPAASSGSRTATVTATSSNTTESVRFVGGSPSDWTVMLLIDHREEDAELIQTSMLCEGFACETLQLAVGDFLWVARHKTLSGEQVVLDVILERKTVNDLAASIIDGRYNEQKVRLKQAAIPTSAYIIEGNLSAQDRMDPGSLRTAMTTTEVIHGLRVIPTRNIDHSIRVIQSLFEQQVRAWPQTFGAFTSGRRVPVSFADFQKRFVKRSAQTVGDVFRAQLRQLPNCSATRASVLNQQFGTMRQLLQHFDRLPDRKAIEQSLTALQSDQRTKPIGPALAKFITRLYLDEF